MKKSLPLLLASPSPALCPPRRRAPTSPAGRSGRRAVTIVRDDWGIPHIYGKTDADVVFGLMYAQAEDDFNRVETNFINSMGRLAEAEGEAEVYRDLRMKLFINPDSMKAKYAASPEWLKKLMIAWADGLNFYLYKHPEVTPRVIKTLRAVDGADVQRRQHRRRHREGEPERAAGVLRRQHRSAGDARAKTPTSTRSRRDRTASRSRRRTPSAHHALLLINPHTSFFFRAEVQMVSEEGLNAYGAVTWGQFFIYQGFNDRAGWMHTTSNVDDLDEYLETVVQKGDRYFYKYGNEERPMTATKVVVPYKTATGMAQKEFTVYRTHHGPVIRKADGKWVAIRIMQEPVKALTQSYSRTKAKNYKEFRADDGPAHQLVEQHDLRRRRRRHRLLPRQLHSEARHAVRLDEAGRRQRSRHGVEGTACRSKRARICSIRRAAGCTTSTTGRGPRPARAARRRRTIRRTSRTARNRRADSTRSACCRTRRTSRSTRSATAAYDSYLPAFDDDDSVAAQGVRRHAGDESAQGEGCRSRSACCAPGTIGGATTSVPTSLAVFWGEEIGRRVGADARRAGIPVDDYVATKATPDQLLQALVDGVRQARGGLRQLENAVGRHQSLPAPHRRHRAAVQRRRRRAFRSAFTSSRWGSLASFGATRLPGHEEVVRHQRQQLRRRGRVRRQRARQGRDRRRRERTSGVAALQRRSAAIRHRQPARRVLLSNHS